MRLLNRMGCLLLIGIVLLSIGVNAQAKVALVFAEETQCTGIRILLGEIAQIQGGEDSLVLKLKSTDLGPSPSPGGRFTLTQEIIKSNIIRQGIPLSEVELIGIGPRGIIVRGAGQLVEQERVLEKAYDYVYSQLPGQFAQVEILVKSFPEIWLPYGDYQIEVGPHRSTNIWGFLSLPVTILMNGEQVDRKQVSLEVKVFQAVFVARAPLARAVTVAEEMVELSYQEVTALRGEPVVTGAELFGKVTKRAITQGEVITQDVLEIPKMVVRNERVTIEVSLGGIYIQTMGKALQDGGLGDWISVVNSTSGITILAQVTGKGKVQAQVKPKVD